MVKKVDKQDKQDKQDKIRKNHLKIPTLKGQLEAVKKLKKEKETLIKCSKNKGCENIISAKKMSEKNMKNLMIIHKCNENNKNIKDRKRCINDYQKSDEFKNFNNLAIKKVECMKKKCKKERQNVINILNTFGKYYNLPNFK